jgi:dTDP-4-amino-4,6-dideoxygalactose transaminase
MHSIDQLAIFGGTPSFANKLHVGRPNIGQRETIIKYFNQILDNRWFTNNGPFVQDFERRIAEMVGVNHCIAVCNGTIAMEIAVRALELKGEVIVPSMTFIATAHSLQWQEITPAFCDVDPSTHNIDPERIERLISPRTTGIIGVHLWGRPCNTEALYEIANKHGLRLLFDAAHAFGCSYGGKMIGCFGDAEIFSFHATKFFNSFEGGAVLTNNPDLAAKIRLMKNFGFRGYDNVVHVGTNGKMTEVCAAMGLAGLDSLEEFIGINYRNYKTYRQELSGIPGVQLISYDDNERNNYQYIVLEVDEVLAGIHRDMIVKTLHGENVLARRYFYPGCHKMEPYRSDFSRRDLQLPHTERLVQWVMSLPTGTAVEPEEIVKICCVIRYIVENGKAIRRRLGET